MDVHVAAALDANGGTLGVESFLTTTVGFADLHTWLSGFGTLDRVGVEGTGAYDGDRCVVDAGSLRVEIERATGGVRFITEGGVEIAADDGNDAVGWADGGVQVRKRRHPDERHAGFGERSSLDQTAATKTFWNVNAREYGPEADGIYCSVPVFPAHRPAVTYGFFLNALGWSQIRAEPGSDTWVAAVAGRELDYVVVHGDEPAVVLERLTALLGRVELPPRWALGYHQSHWGYDSAATLRSVADEFARRRLPCDVLHLDIKYMDDHQVFTWDPERFPDPAALTAELGERGLRCDAIVDAGVKQQPGIEVFDSGLELDAFVRDAAVDHVSGFVWPGRCVFPDFLRADVRDWWAKLHTTLLDAGVAGIWNDMNEPAIYAKPIGTDSESRLVERCPPTRGRVRPITASATPTCTTCTGCRRSARPAMRWRGCARRPDRSHSAVPGFAGIQCYAAVWTGDNSASWEHLQLPMLVQPRPLWRAVRRRGHRRLLGDGTPELFARWIQAGVLYPFMRGHSHKENRPDEPWEFGDEVEAVARGALRLRSALRPYLYTLFHEAATTGAPVLRPLLWSFSADPRAAAIEDVVMLGDSVLAAPVLHEGQRQREVYLPAGGWYDWWTGEAHDGLADVQVAAPGCRCSAAPARSCRSPLSTTTERSTIPP